MFTKMSIKQITHQIEQQNKNNKNQKIQHFLPLDLIKNCIQIKSSTEGITQ